MSTAAPEAPPEVDALEAAFEENIECCVPGCGLEPVWRIRGYCPEHDDWSDWWPFCDWHYLRFLLLARVKPPRCPKTGTLLRLESAPL